MLKTPEKQFDCIKCKYSCIKKSHWKQHIKTKKHKKHYNLGDNIEIDIEINSSKSKEIIKKTTI